MPVSLQRQERRSGSHRISITLLCWETVEKHCINCQLTELILSLRNTEVTVLESHYVPGGAAHTFRTRAKGIEGDFCFDSGPSLYGGLSGERTSSPLKHVYQILGEEPEWIQYDRLGLG